MKNRNLWLAGTALALYVMVPAGAFALPTVDPNQNPTGGAFTSGNGAITGQNTNYETITQTSSKGIVTWDTFNIGANATTEFKQNGGVTLNKIGDSNPSQIFGHLKADGTVMLVNKNGIMFQQGSTVDVGSLVATTQDIDKNSFNNPSNGVYTFDNGGSTAGKQVVNNGTITVKQGGIAALVAPSVQNNGTINAQMAKVSLAGGEKFTVDLAGDGLVNLQLPTKSSGNVNNTATGKIMANGGTVQLAARDASNLVDSMINTDGVVQADKVIVDGPRISLGQTIASNNVTGKNVQTVSHNNSTVDINQSIGIVNTGGNVNLAQGTYTTGEVFMNKTGVSLNGKTTNAADTKLNITNNGGFGVLVTADNAKLKNLTVNGAGTTQNPIKITGNVQAAGANLPYVDGVQLSNVAVTGGTKSMVDINGASHTKLDNVKITGHGSYAGVAITDSNNTTLNNLTTSGDGYGIALQTTGTYAPGGINGVTLTGTNSIGEDLALLTSVANGYGISNVNAPDITYTTQDAALSGAGYGFYSTNQQSAINLALGQLPVNGDVVVQGVNGGNNLAVNNQFYVGESADRSKQMGIQAAINAANGDGTGVVNVLAGTYTLPGAVNLNKSISVQGAGDGVTNINGANANGYAFNVTADNTKLGGFYLYSAGYNTGGVQVNGANHVALSNFDVDGNTNGDKVSIVDSKNVTADNVRAFGNNHSGAGFKVDGSKHITLSNDTTSGNNDGGIVVNNSQDVDLTHDSSTNNGQAGIQLTDSRGVTLKNDSTSGNSLTGLLVTANEGGDGVNNVLVDNTDTFGEANKITTIDYGSGLTNLKFNGYGYVLNNSVVDQMVDGTVNAYQQSKSDAVAFSRQESNYGNATTIQGLDHAGNGAVSGNNSWYVPTNLSIQTAIDAAKKGGIINLFKGLYDQAFNVDKSLTVNGKGDSFDPNQGTVIAPSNAKTAIRISANHVTLNDLAVEGGVQSKPPLFALAAAEPGFPIIPQPPMNNSLQHGIVIAPKHNNGTIEDVTLNNVKVQNANQSNILIKDADGVKLKNVKAFDSATGEGVEIRDSSDVKLKNVDTHGNAGGGVLVQAIHRNSDDVFISQDSRFHENWHLYTKEPLDNGFQVTDLNPGVYVYTAHNPQYDQAVGAKTVFYYRHQKGAQKKQDFLDTNYPAPVNTGLALDDDAATRETTRRASGGPGSAVASLGTGSVFDLLQPAEGGDSDNQDISQRPLDANELAVGQNFLQSGQVTSGPVALNKLLSQAGAAAPKKPAQ